MLRAFLVVCLIAVPQIGTGQSDIDPRITQLVAQVSEQRLEMLLKQLVTFETRFLHSNPDPQGKGIGAARQWILDELTRASPRLQVSFDTYHVTAQGERLSRPVELRNVMRCCRAGRLVASTSAATTTRSPASGASSTGACRTIPRRAPMTTAAAPS